MAICLQIFFKLGTNIPFFSIYNLKKFFGQNKETQAYTRIIYCQKNQKYLPQKGFSTLVFGTQEIFLKTTHLCFLQHGGTKFNVNCHTYSWLYCIAYLVLYL